MNKSKRPNKPDKSGYKLSWSELKRDWPIWLVMAGLFLAGALLYNQLPQEMPNHWNYKGEVDGYMAKPWGVFFLPVLTVGLYLMMLAFPFLDPRRGNYSKFTGTYRLFRSILVLFFAVIFGVSIVAGLGYNVPVNKLIMVAVGLLFVVMGNSMGRVRHNWFIGIRTPWALADEEVWRLTHRFAAKWWTVAGLVSIAITLLLPVSIGSILAFLPVGIAAVASIVYSYFAWTQRQE